MILCTVFRDVAISFTLNFLLVLKIMLVQARNLVSIKLQFSKTLLEKF